MDDGNGPPKGPLARGLAGGGTAVRMGGVYLKYAAKRPFLDRERGNKARREMSGESARALFKGLCRLKGTALKAAQLLSLECDLFPPEVRAELERACDQVPPMNRALVRKVLANAYGRAPGEVFASHEGTAFAAASLGQVHRATARDGRALALKIQYPGIRETIRSDMRLLRAALRPFGEYGALEPALREVEERFIEETDYRREAWNTAFFRECLDLEPVVVPEVLAELCTDKVLCMTYLDARPLNAWLGTGPSARERDAVAQTLQDVFIRGVHDLGRLHADPNPGNFLVFPDARVGLVDFGCVKSFGPDFVSLYRQLVRAVNGRDREASLEALRALGTLPRDMDPDMEGEAVRMFGRYGDWLRRLYVREAFDFGRNPDFIAEGKAISWEMKSLWRILNINPDFVFLDRTRYGLFRLFERMGARVRFRNPHEWPG